MLVIYLAIHYCTDCLLGIMGKGRPSVDNNAACAE